MPPVLSVLMFCTSAAADPLKGALAPGVSVLDRQSVTFVLSIRR